MRGRTMSKAAAAALSMVLFASAFSAIEANAAEGGTSQLVSVAANGSATLTAASTTPAVSGDGRYVAFDSAATQVVTGDTNGASDVFVRDRVAGKNVRVSKNDQGNQAAGASTDPVMSPNGRYVAFVSSASIDDGVGEGNEGVCDPPGPDEAEPGQGSETRDKNGTKLDVYVFNRDADGNGIFDEAGCPEPPALKSFCGVSTDLVSVDSNELQGQNASKSVSVEPGIAISANGRYVAFATGTQIATGDTNDKVDVYLRDRDTDADGIYDEPESSNTIWVSGGSINAPNGASLSPSVSDDGSLVAFESTATNLAAGPGANGAAIRHLRQERQDRRR